MLAPPSLAAGQLSRQKVGQALKFVVFIPQSDGKENDGKMEKEEEECSEDRDSCGT